jgi:uncharacterized membrane protein (UPF0127 family)
MIRPLLIAALASLCACASVQAQECPSPPENDTIDFGGAEPLTVQSGDQAHAFNVQIADDPMETARGLMFRPEIAPDFGMLFVFPESSERSFYMRNTCASLDIIFVRADGEIVSMVRNAVPFSLRTLPSNGPVKAVLEIAGGRAAELGIEPGDKVISARLGDEATPTAAAEGEAAPAP